MNDFALNPTAAARYDKRLAIIVPYRDRAEHRAAFIPHIITYFQRDKLDRRIAMSLHLVEQNGTAPFNRGKLLNAGYQLVRGDADYVCFHDVDYLPLWADYSWSPRPARLIWHGLRLQEDWKGFFGGVVLFDKQAFEQINGFPNAYWGWGYEDMELRQRCEFAGMDFERRDGTFSSLPHQHNAYSAPGVPTPEALAMKAFAMERQKQLPRLIAADGLSTLSFTSISNHPIALMDRVVPGAFHHVVDIGVPER